MQNVADHALKSGVHVRQRLDFAARRQVRHEEILSLREQITVDGCHRLSRIGQADVILATLFGQPPVDIERIFAPGWKQIVRFLIVQLEKVLTQPVRREFLHLMKQHGG